MQRDILRICWRDISQKLSVAISLVATSIGHYLYLSLYLWSLSLSVAISIGLLALTFPTADALVALLAHPIAHRPFYLRLRQLEAGDHWSMIRFGVEDPGGENYGLVMQ
jgi:hypothetical protein